MGKNKNKNKLKIKQMVSMSNAKQDSAQLEKENHLADATVRQSAANDNQQNIDNNIQINQHQENQEFPEPIGQPRANQKVQIGPKIQKQVGNSQDNQSTENLHSGINESNMKSNKKTPKDCAEHFEQFSKEQNEWKAEQTQQSYRPFKIQKENTPTCAENSNQNHSQYSPKGVSNENLKKEISQLKALHEKEILDQDMHASGIDQIQQRFKKIQQKMQTMQTKQAANDKHLNISNGHSKKAAGPKGDSANSQEKKVNKAQQLDQNNIQLFSPLNSSERSSKSSHLNISKLSNQPVQMFAYKDNVKVIKRPAYISRGGSPRSSSLNSAQNMPFNYNSKDDFYNQNSDGRPSLWSSEDKHSSISFDASLDNGLNLYENYIHLQNLDQHEQMNGQRDQELAYYEIFESYHDDLDFMDDGAQRPQQKVKQQEAPAAAPVEKPQGHDVQARQKFEEKYAEATKIQKELHAADKADPISLFETKLETEQIEYKKEQAKQIQIQSLIDLQSAFNKDKQNIQDKMARCLISIYNQQDMSQYFSDMIKISEIMKIYYDNSKVLLNNRNQFASLKGQSLFRLFQQIEAQASPKYLKKIMTEIIGDIMNNICEQILQKMKQLGVIIKEPLHRRASHDDYQLCFENFSKKPSNGQNQHQANIFGYGFGNQGVFTNQINLRNLNDSKNDLFKISSTQGNFAGKGTTLGGSGQNSNVGYYNSLNFAYKQQQEMHLESGKNYEYIRKEGKKATWEDIWSSRKRLQRFIHRQNEYKKVFDMILRSYRQLKGSLEYLEEFWMYLNESIYDHIETGKLQFDRIWKDLYHERILENKFIKHFLNDVSDQYEGLQSYHQKQISQNANRYILDEIYENLVKLETDLNQDYVVEEFLNLDALVNEDGYQDALQQSIFDSSNDMNNEYQNLDENTLQQQKFLQQQIEYVILNQYGLIYDKLKARYGGKSLSQLICSCDSQKPENIYKGIQQVQKLCEQYQKQAAQAQALESRNIQSQSKHRTDQAQATLSNQKQQQQTSSTKKKKSNRKKQSAIKKEQQQQEAAAAKESQNEHSKGAKPVTQEGNAYLNLNPKDICEKIKLNIPAKSNKPFLKKKFMDTIDKIRNNPAQQAYTQSKDQDQDVSSDNLDAAENGEDANLNSEQAKAEKKKKLNQKKKRQRNEKKKRQQEENELLIQQQVQLQQQQDIEDQQLLELIYRYDKNISQSDKDYLMQVEDREQVINTLQAKLIERENPQLININGEGGDCDNQLEYQYDDQYCYDQYGDEDEFNSAGVDGVEGEDEDIANVYYQQNDQIHMMDYQTNTHAENIDAIQDRQKLGLLHNSNFQMQHNTKSRSNQRQMSSDKSDISYEEEIYDSEFEEELKQFQYKLQARENSFDGAKFDTKRRNGSAGRQTRKLIPNVSPAWIDKLRKQLKEQYICKSQDDQIEQVYNNSNEYSQYFLQYPAPHKHFNEITQAGGMCSKIFQTSRMKDVGKLAFNKCLTNSTTGISFNSPPATERACGYDFDPNGGQMVDINSIEAAQFYYAEEYQMFSAKNNSAQAQQSMRNVQNSAYINIEDEDQYRHSDQKDLHKQTKIRNSDVSCMKPANMSSQMKQNIDQDYLCVASQHQSA